MWSNPDEAKKVTQESTQLRRIIKSYETLEGDIEGLEELFEIATDDELEELNAEKSACKKRLICCTAKPCFLATM